MGDDIKQALKDIEDLINYINIQNGTRMYYLHSKSLDEINDSKKALEESRANINSAIADIQDALIELSESMDE